MYQTEKELLRMSRNPSRFSLTASGTGDHYPIDMNHIISLVSLYLYTSLCKIKSNARNHPSVWHLPGNTRMQAYA